MMNELIDKIALKRIRRFACAGLATTFIFMIAPAAFAQDAISGEQFGLNNMLLLVSGALVFWMHAGFAMLEAGMTRAKNTVNILAKNVAIVAISGVTYYLVGFGLMYPGDFNGVLGFASGSVPNTSPDGYADGAYTVFSDFFFQGESSPSFEGFDFVRICG